MCFQIFYLVINKIRCEVLYGGILVRYLVEKHVGTHLGHKKRLLMLIKTINRFYIHVFGNNLPEKLLLLVVMDCGTML